MSNLGSNPVGFVAAGAQRYQRQNGLYSPAANFGQVAVSHAASDQVADAYGRMASFNAGAVPAYRQMGEETKRQFDFMTAPQHKGGLGISVNVQHHDPYSEGGESEIYSRFRNDVGQNRHMDVLSTASTGGHPVFSNDENDMFRAVHDVFGHLGTGRAIDRHGEDAAYQKHRQMFSPLAQQALATETRGQNAALQKHGDFQEQKIGILPTFMQHAQFMSRGVTPGERSEAFAENLKHGVVAKRG